jgi:hypothetical protein
MITPFFGDWVRKTSKERPAMPVHSEANSIAKLRMARSADHTSPRKCSFSGFHIAFLRVQCRFQFASRRFTFAQERLKVRRLLRDIGAAA